MDSCQAITNCIYCNYGNYETPLFLFELRANATVIMVITEPHCNYDSFEPPAPVHAVPVLQWEQKQEQDRASVKRLNKFCLCMYTYINTKQTN